ncbi:MAG: T9SS type A sorting domain-containing protein [Bacteroidota bacterium]
MKKILSLCFLLLIYSFGQSQIKSASLSQHSAKNPGTLKSTQVLNAPITTAGSATASACPNGNIVIPLTVNNFTNVGAMTLRLDYDSTLRFIGYSNLNTALSGTLISADSAGLTVKKILISWTFSTNPVNLTNGSKILDLNFKILSGSPILQFNNTANGGSLCEYAYFDINLQDVLSFNDSPTSTYYINPTITNLGAGTPETISGSNPVYQNQSNISYTVPTITNATSYIWTLPTGASGLSSTSTITVNYGAAAVSGNITVKGNNATCGDGPSKSLPIIVGNTNFTAAVSSDWNIAGNWDHGMPNATTNITIPPLKLAVINAVNDSCNNLTIAPLGQLTINSTKNLVVKGTLSLLSDTTGSASLIDYGTISATTTIAQRYLTGNVFHQIGLPITSISAGSGVGQTGSVFLNCSIDKYKEDSNTYIGLTATSTITANQGYLVKYVYTAGSPAPTSKVLNFTGNLNSGNLNIPMTKSGLGFNLIPNPYPSSIDWNALSWDKSLLANNTIYIWNQGSSGNQWATYDGNAGVNNGNRYIAPGQAFFVTATSAGNLQMTNNVRIHNNIGFLKSSNILVDNLIKLKVSGDSNEGADETAIYFSNNPLSPGSEKWFSFEPTAPSLYSIKNNVDYAINVLDDANSNVVVPLAFKAGVDGNYTFNAIEIGNFTLCSTILLEDNKTGLIQDFLNNTVYNFTASTTDYANRFLLHFEAAPNAIGKDHQTETNIYAYEKSIYINTKEKIKQISVYNLSGQLLSGISNVSGFQKINLNGNTIGCYIVRLITENQVYTEKIILK